MRHDDETGGLLALAQPRQSASHNRVELLGSLDDPSPEVIGNSDHVGGRHRSAGIAGVYPTNVREPV